MRKILALAAAFGLAACFTNTAHAQGGRGGMGMMGGPNAVQLLTNKGVQKELKLTDEQIEKAEKASTELGEKMQERRQDLQNVDQAERMEKMQAMMAEMRTEAKKSANEILKDDQKKRFEQIAYQAQGVGAYADPEVQAKLKMTDEQKSKVKDAMDESMQQMRSAFQDNQGDREAMQKRMTEIRTEMTNKVTALLTDDQKKMWKDMTGEKFDYVPEAPRRRQP